MLFLKQIGSKTIRTKFYVYDYLLNGYGVSYFISKEDWKSHSNSICSSKAYRCESVKQGQFKSQFSNKNDTEKFHIQNIRIGIDYENKGLMTIMICDILLTVLLQSKKI